MKDSSAKRANGLAFMLIIVSKIFGAFCAITGTIIVVAWVSIYLRHMPFQGNEGAIYNVPGLYFYALVCWFGWPLLIRGVANGIEKQRAALRQISK
jgi:hypothetical protein